MPYRRRSSRYGRRRTRRRFSRRRPARLRRYRRPSSLTHKRRIIVSRTLQGGVGTPGNPGTLPSYVNLSFSLDMIDPGLLAALSRCWDSCAIYKIKCKFMPQDYFNVNAMAVKMTTAFDPDLFSGQQPTPGTVTSDELLTRYGQRTTLMAGNATALRVHQHTIRPRPVTPLYLSAIASGYQTQKKVAWLDLQSVNSPSVPHAGLSLAVTGSSGTDPLEPIPAVVNIQATYEYTIIFRRPL